jgi:hypothetical protein
MLHLSDIIHRSYVNYITRSLMICTAHQYYLGEQTEKNEMGGACNTHGDRRGVYRVLMGIPEGKRPFGRPRRRWEDNFKTGLREVVCGGMDWIELSQD